MIFGDTLMFIGRKEELEVLESLYQKAGFSMAVIYGRRRVGKSTLISKFISDRKAVYYVATKTNQRHNLNGFAREVINTLQPELGNIEFSALEDVLSFISSKAEDEKLILVIDELPYWAEQDHGMLSIFQKFIDTSWAEKNLLLILCGSALSFMENEVLSEKSPVFGRRDIQIKLDVFNYREAAEFVPNYSPEEKMIVYGVTGGVAKYLAMFDPLQSLDENICSLFFRSSGFLYEEPHNLLAQEFTEVSVVNSVIEQIASGENTLNLIADKIHESDQTVLYALKRLISIGIVEKQHCITEEKNKKKTRYILKDQMFRFWYSFVPAGVSAIECHRGETYFLKMVKPQIHNYMGKVFEDICRAYVLTAGLDGKLNCFITSVGTWWGQELISDEAGKTKYLQADVDVVGVAPMTKEMVIGECKFRNEKMDISALNTLIRRGEAIPAGYRKAQYLLFSLSGFSDGLKERAGKDVQLLQIGEMF